MFGDWIIYLLENEGGWVLIIGIVGFLAVEFALDVVHDIFMDWLRERKK